MVNTNQPDHTEMAPVTGEDEQVPPYITLSEIFAIYNPGLWYSYALTMHSRSDGLNVPNGTFEVTSKAYKIPFTILTLYKPDKDHLDDLYGGLVVISSVDKNSDSGQDTTTVHKLWSSY